MFNIASVTVTSFLLIVTGVAGITDVSDKAPPAVPQLLIALGGWSAGPEPFQEITASDYKMNNFVYDTVDFIRKNQLDGIDIDWEYPRWVGS